MSEEVWEAVKDGRDGLYREKCGAVWYVEFVQGIKMYDLPCPFCGAIESILWIFPPDFMPPAMVKTVLKHNGGNE